MKKMKDERLILQTLKNIRIAYIVLMLGVLFILVKQFTVDGINVFATPLFFVMVVSNSVLAVMNMGVSIDYASTGKKSYLDSYRNIIWICAAVGVAFMALYWFLSPERVIWEALLSGVVFFVCFLIPFSIGYRMKKKRSQHIDD
ncbi:branched-chain amino acid ABC transporter substrate-binding protein [Paenibacillus sp. KN14-4R]|uniref:branched-chain amino acid ABC transporter substrate-binding protein n=1 Tax=Paenibacillus sp. KN14-4R TaxID=3445773 RepID=UPI003FA15EE6